MKKYIVLIAALVLFVACDKEEKWQAPVVETQKSTFIDSRDGAEYKCITINGQTWMAENLKYRLPRGPLDGCLTYEEEADSVKLIDNLKTKLSIDKAIFSERVRVLCPNSVKFGTPECMVWWMFGAEDEFCHPTRGKYYKSSYVVYEKNYLMPTVIQPYLESNPSAQPALKSLVEALRQANMEQEEILLKKAIDAEADQDYLAQYGYLYSYKNIEQAIPEGWRLPTDEDWKKLEQSLGLTDELLEKMEQWRGGGVASLLKLGETGVGFDAEYPGCFIYGQVMTGSKYRNQDFKAYYWTATTLSMDNRECAIIRSLQYNQEGIFRGTSPTIQSAYSIRCIKK